MSGGRFLVSLCAVKNSERILAYRALLLGDVNFWMEDLSPDVLHTTLDEFAKLVEEDDSHIYEATLTNEVATIIAGYVGKKMSQQSQCNSCKSSLIATTDNFDNKYFNMLSRGNLTIPSPHGGYNRFKMFRCDVTHKLIFNINRKIIAENMRNWSDTYWHFVTSLAC